MSQQGSYHSNAILKDSIKLKWNFQQGGVGEEFRPKKPFMQGGMNIFWNDTRQIIVNVLLIKYLDDTVQCGSLLCFHFSPSHDFVPWNSLVEPFLC